MEKFKYRGVYLLLLCSVLVHTSCATPQRDASEPTSFAEGGDTTKEGQVTQAELQDDLLRFESQFNARIQSANQSLENSKSPKIRYRATLNRLIYSSNSLGIALGPSPESNLLDMVTFIELSHDVLKMHWIPHVFGTAGQPLDEAFAESRSQIWAIAEKVLDTEQRNRLEKVILEWRKKHPEQINVETVRLSAFSTEAGAKAAGLDENVGGLFASVQQSTQAVDSARLFAERALYYAERAPFLFRLQARLGAYEIVDDAGLTLAQLPLSLSAQEPVITGLMKELQQTLLITRATLGDANSTVKSVSSLMDQLSGDPQAANSATAAITELTALLKEWNHLLGSEPYQQGVSRAAGLANQISRESSRFLKNLALLGVGLITFFWIMYVLAKLAYGYFLLRLPGGTAPERRDERRDKAA